MSLTEKVRELGTYLNVVREKHNRTSSSKLDNMLSVQKSSSNKTRSGFVKNGSSSMMASTKFVPFVSVPKLDVRVQKEENQGRFK